MDLAQTEELFKANFDPSQARDDQGRWTDEGDEGRAGNITPASGRSPSHSNPWAWGDFPNPDFRNRLAVAEQTADRPHYGYREVHDSRDLRGHRNLAVGRYQMTPLALESAGMMDRNGNWTGKYGIHSQAQFLANPAAQERALSDYLADNERQLQALGAFGHLGQTIDGLQDRFTVTRAGLMAAAHRYGAPATRHYLHRIAGHGYSSKELDLTGQERAIETRLRTFSGASYE